LDSVLKVRELETTFYLKTGPFRAVNRISYDIGRGETLGIVGESGCGKSVTSFSLMKLVATPGKITHGSAELNGIDLVKQKWR
jgi:peptide/nickel transport system ATP-binding protein